MDLASIHRINDLHAMTEHILYDRPRQRHSLPPGSVADLIDHFLQVPCHLQQPLWRMASRTRQNYQKARTITHCNWSFRLTNGYTSEWLSPAGLPLQELQSDCCATLTLQPSCCFLRAERWCQRIRTNRSLSNAKMAKCSEILQITFNIFNELEWYWHIIYIDSIFWYKYICIYEFVAFICSA